MKKISKKKYESVGNPKHQIREKIFVETIFVFKMLGHPRTLSQHW